MAGYVVSIKNQWNNGLFLDIRNEKIKQPEFNDRISILNNLLWKVINVKK